MRFDKKSGVYITGAGQLKVEKHSELSIREIGAKAIHLAMEDAGVEKVDAIYLGNMLSGMLSHQQQLGAIVATQAGLKGTEAFTIDAACGSGGAALRTGFMAIMSGLCETVVVCGLEKMSHEDKNLITKSIATASDWETEGGKGETFVTLNAWLMKRYIISNHKTSPESFAMFSVNAHKNAAKNPYALFHKEIDVKDYLHSKFITAPIRLYDASPVCDGAAAIVLSKYPRANTSKNIPQVKIIASSASTEAVAISDRKNLLSAEGIQRSGDKTYQMAGITCKDVDFFELHDAYSIISILSLEAMGFAKPGEGWKLALEGEITLEGKIPISTFGGLKARGHPLGASGVYQAVEAYLQLTGLAAENQIKKECKLGLIQSIGGAASTVITHVLIRNG